MIITTPLNPASLGFKSSVPGHGPQEATVHPRSQSYAQLTCTCGSVIHFGLRNEGTEADARGMRHWQEHLLGAVADPSEKLRLGEMRQARSTKSIYLMPLTNPAINSFASTDHDRRCLNGERGRINFGVVMETVYSGKGKTKRTIVSLNGTREEAIMKGRALLSKQQLQGADVDVVAFGTTVQGPTRLSIFADALARADEATDIASMQEALDEIKEMLGGAKLLESKRQELVERLHATLMRPSGRL